MSYFGSSQGYHEQQSFTKGILHRDGYENPIEGFKKTKTTEVIFWVVVVFSFGLVYLLYAFLKVYSPYWAAQIRFKSVRLADAEIILVQDVRNNLYERCRVHTVTIDEAGATIPSLASAVSSSSEISIEHDDTTPLNKYRVCDVSEIKYVTFIYGRYIYSRPFNSFYPLTGLDGDNPMKRPSTSINGLKADDVRTLQKIYGANEMKINEDSYIKIFMDNVMDAYYIFQIFTLILWGYAGYYYYCAGIILVSTIVIWIAVWRMKRYGKSLLKDLECEASVTVVRDGYQYYIPHTELVPGDIVVLNKSSKYITFDGIIIKGSIFTNHALLNGVTQDSYRYVAHDRCININGKFDKLSPTATEQSNSVFAGTYCIEHDSVGDQDDVLTLVVNTGFLTLKGMVIREAQAPDMYSYSLDNDSVTYFKFLLTLGAVAFGVALIIFWCLLEESFEDEPAIVAALRLVTLAIPPSLPLALTVAFLWSTRRLTRVNIATRNYRRIAVGGRIQSIVFDKTGTLTKNKMEYIGHLEVYTEEEGMHLSELNTATDMEKGDVLYLMASCHSLAPIKSGEHSLDRAMFEVTEWDLVAVGGTNNVRVYSGRSDNLGEYKIDILKRFPFRYERKILGVIVKIVHEDRAVYYIKGQPQSILNCCDPASIPPFTDSKLKSFTTSGYRVLAMAKKDLNDSEEEKKLGHKDLENDMKFLGFLVFGDKLAEGAVEVIQNLKTAKFTTIMCTGDDLDTAVHVARQVGIIPESGGRSEEDKVIRFKASIDKNKNLEVFASDYDDGSRYPLASAWGECWDPQSPNYVIDGESWNILDEVGGSELDRILLAGKVFAEMTPKYKKALVELQHKIGYETCMVGDGANDNEALRAADVGISLRCTESALAASFYSNTNDIKAVEDLLNEGRTAHSQLLTIFMFTACYSVLGMVAETIMYSLLYELSEAEWIYIDLLLVMSIDLLLGYSESRQTICTSRRSESFFNSIRLFSMFSFLVICVGIQVGVLFYLEDQSWYVHVATSFTELTEGSMEATYAFFLLIFQLTFPAIVYTMKWEAEPIYKNTIMLCLFAILYSINTYLDLFSSNFINNIFEFNVSPSMWFRVQILIFALGNLIINIIVEYFFICYRSKRSKM